MVISVKCIFLTYAYFFKAFINIILNSKGMTYKIVDQIHNMYLCFVTFTNDYLCKCWRLYFLFCTIENYKHSIKYVLIHLIILEMTRGMFYDKIVNKFLPENFSPSEDLSKSNTVEYLDWTTITEIHELQISLYKTACVVCSVKLNILFRIGTICA